MSVRKGSQRDREFAFHCLEIEDADRLMVYQMEGYEELGRPYRYELVLLSDEGDIPHKDLLGRTGVVRVSLDGQPLRTSRSVRVFNGLISEFALLPDKEAGLFRYRAVLVPPHWRLTLTRGSAVHRGTVPEIVKAVCSAYNAGPVEDENLSGTYVPRIHCVQYRETAFAFITRILEEEGLYYTFQHEADGVTRLVLMDSKEQMKPWSEDPDLPFEAPQDTAAFITSWKGGMRLLPTEFGHRDFDFTMPLTMNRQETFLPVVVPEPSVKLTAYDYPSGVSSERYDFQGSGSLHEDACEDRAHIGVQRILIQGEEMEGCTETARALAPGTWFRLPNPPHPGYGGEHAVLRMTLRFTSNAYLSKSLADLRGKPEIAFHARFRTFLLKGDDPSWEFRPRRTVERPVIPGLQTAVVVGPEDGEEIWTDDGGWGRVKVQFFWDRRDVTAPEVSDTSCWVRVAQARAGSGYGTWFLPRVGEEVVVAFLDGDPDRPLVVGGVYNESNEPPYPLPEHATRSTIRTASTPSEAGGFNEIRFEDQAGEEQVFLHAQKYWDRIVEDESCDTVRGRRHEVTEKDRREKVDGSRHSMVEKESRSRTADVLHESVGGEHRESVGKDRHTRVENDLRTSVGKDRHETVGQDSNLAVSGDRSTLVGGADIVKVGSGGRHVTVQGPVSEIIQGQHYEQTQSQYFLSAGQVVIEASDGVSIKTGGSFVHVGSGGVNISGDSVNLNCDGAKAADGSPVTGRTPAESLPAEQGADPFPAKNAGDVHATGPQLVVEHAMRSLPRDGALNFGDGTVGGGIVETLTLYNAGDGDLLLEKAEILPGDGAKTDPPTVPTEFRVPPEGLIVGEGEGEILSVAFRPKAPKPRLGRLRLTHNGFNSPYDIRLEGTGVGPEICIRQAPRQEFEPLSPSRTLQLPPPTIGRGAARCVLEVHNRGEKKLAVSSVSLAGKDADRMKVSPGVFLVQPGALEEVNIEVAADDPGTLSAQLLIQSNDPARPSLSIPLEAVPTWLELLDEGGALSSRTDPVDGGSVQLGGHTTCSLTLANRGKKAEQLTLHIQGAEDQFSITPAEPVVQPGEEAVLTLSFKPESRGRFQALLDVHGPHGSEYTAWVTAQGTAPCLKLCSGGGDLKPEDGLHLGGVSPGRSVTRKLTLANTGDAALHLFSLDLEARDGGTLPADSGLSVSEINPVLQPDASEEVTFTFKPPSPGDCLADAVIASSDPDQPRIRLPLTAAGLGFHVADGPAILDNGGEFYAGAAPVGGNLTRTLAVANASGAPLPVSRISLEGDRAQDFLISPAAFTLQPGGRQILTVVFNGDSPGVKTAVARVAVDGDPVYALALHAGATALVVEHGGLPLSHRSILHAGRGVFRALGDLGQTVTVSNPSDGRISFSVKIRNQDSRPDFYVIPAQAALAPGEKKDLQILPSPDAGVPGERTSYLELSADDMGGATFDLILKVDWSSIP